MPSKALLLLVAWLAGLSAAGVSWCAEETENQPEAQQVEVSASAAEPMLTPEQVALRDQVRRCLAYYFYRPESIRRRSPWGVMHSMVGFGVDTPLLAEDGEVNAIAWLCANGPCNGMRLLYRNLDCVGVQMGPGYQGHSGQFLSILAQSRVKIDYPLVVGGQRLSVADLVKAEQLTCRSGTELTFKLIGLAHYLEVDARWQDQNGETWDLPRLIREELAQPIVGAACGGTHRLMGFSYAVRKCEKSGQGLTGQWLRAKEYLDDYHDYTFRLQNSDGSFSTNWFGGRSNHDDIDRKLNTTGHTLEWLVYSLPKERLADERVVQAVEFLTDLMWRYRGHEWEIGPKGHAVHALALYDERLLGGLPGQRSEQLIAAQNMAETPASDDQHLVQAPANSPADMGQPGRNSNRTVRRRSLSRR